MGVKKLVVLFMLSVFFGTSAQEYEKGRVKKTIEAFFEAFHAQDSLGIKRRVADDMVLQTIGIDDRELAVVHTENFNTFLRHIVNIPKTTTFEEKITSYNIQIDGALAHVWTHYEFWVNGKRSHCGVNSFQLFNGNDGWKIIYLIDTRHKSGC